MPVRGQKYGVMPDLEQSLAQDVQAPESPSTPASRAMKHLIDLDRLVSALPKMLPQGKSDVFRQRLGYLANLCLALRLSIHLERPTTEIVDICSQLDLATRQTAHLAAKSSLPRGAQLAFQLLSDLSAQLRLDVGLSLPD